MWRIASRGTSRGGELFVRDISTSGFIFDLTIYSGSHTGQVTGVAKIVSKDLAYARIPDGDYDRDNDGDGVVEGEIRFRRTIIGGTRVIQTEETASCMRYHGMGVSFSGNYERLGDTLFELGRIDELQLSRIYNITGQHFHDLMQRFEGVSEGCLLYTSPSPRDGLLSRMPSSA